MNRKWLRLGVFAMVPLLTGCNWLTPLVFVGEHKRKILPEFDKLAAQRVAILVWTDQATLFDYPHARFELATYVGDKLYSEMSTRELDTVVVDPRDVEDFLRREPDAEIDPYAVGKHFNADYVVYLEVIEFQFRNPDEPQFLQGNIRASVSVHDMHVQPRAGRYELAPVQCVYPGGGPVLMSATNSASVRAGTYHTFAEHVARKFYEHTVDL